MLHSFVRGLPLAAWLAIPLLALPAAAQTVSAERFGGSKADAAGTVLDPSKVEILWDSWGVPHIYAGSDQGAYYGLGFACARDRLFHMTYERLISQGRLAEFFGRDTGECDDVCCPSGCPENCDDCDIYLNHDLRNRAFGYPRLAERVVAAMDPQMVALLQAYADGVNAYAALPNAVLHPFFTTYDIPFETWTPEDCVAIWLRVARLFTPTEPLDLAGKLVQFEACNLPPPNDPSYQQLFLQCVDGIYPCRVLDEDGTSVTPGTSNVDATEQQDWLDDRPALGTASQVPPNFYRAHYVDERITFSNAFAVAGNGTTRPAVLVGDPRVPLRAPNSFWEAHMQGPSLEVRGALFVGTPNFVVGSNRFVAWSVTSAGLEQADLFRLETNPANPAEYMLDGAWRPWEVDDVETVYAREPDDTLTPFPINYRESHFGPVITNYVNAADVGPDEEFAVKWVPFHLSAAGAPNLDPSSTRGFFRMYRAHDAESLRKAFSNWTSPGMNCVFADFQGRVGYTLLGSLPLRSRLSPLGGDLAQIGTSTDYDWEAIVPQKLMPWTIREPHPTQVRFVFNGNNTPTGLGYPIPLVNRGGHTYRSRRLQERLTELAGAGNPTPAQVLDIHEDTAWIIARDVAILGRWIRDVQGFAVDPDSSLAIDALMTWADADLDYIPDTTGDGVLLGSPAAAAVSSLARWTGFVPFRSDEQAGEVAQWIVDMYGCGDSGFVNFLRAKLAGIQQVPPVNLAQEEMEHIDRVLSTGWGRNQGIAGATEAEWADWFTNKHLHKELKRWVDVGGLPSLEVPLPSDACDDPSPPVVCVGPVKARFTETLLSQFQQSYTQWVTMDAAGMSSNPAPVRSLMALGQSEHEGSLHYSNQKARWEVDYTSSQVLKPQHLDRQMVLDQNGTSQPLELTYP